MSLKGSTYSVVTSRDHRTDKAATAHLEAGCYLTIGYGGAYGYHLQWWLPCHPTSHTQRRSISRGAYASCNREVDQGRKAPLRFQRRLIFHTKNSPASGTNGLVILLCGIFALVNMF